MTADGGAEMAGEPQTPDEYIASLPEDIGERH
jgi:hypothetical protein